MKAITYIFMLLIFIAPAMAWDIGDNIRINAQYSVAGVPTNVTNATMTITDDRSAIVVDNESMTYNSTGSYYYIFTPTYDGLYLAVANFYDYNVSQGTDSSTFTVGELNTIRWNSCPTGSNGYTGLWIFLILLVVLGVIGFIVKNSPMTAAAGIFLMFTSFMTWYCGEILGYASVIFGIIFLFTAASIRH